MEIPQNAESTGKDPTNRNRRPHLTIGKKQAPPGGRVGTRFKRKWIVSCFISSLFKSLLQN
jgi:hypothetical protein